MPPLHVESESEEDDTGYPCAATSPSPKAIAGSKRKASALDGSSALRQRLANVQERTSSFRAKKAGFESQVKELESKLDKHGKEIKQFNVEERELEEKIKGLAGRSPELSQASATRESSAISGPRESVKLEPISLPTPVSFDSSIGTPGAEVVDLTGDTPPQSPWAVSSAITRRSTRKDRLVKTEPPQSPPNTASKRPRALKPTRGKGWRGTRGRGGRETRRERVAKESQTYEPDLSAVTQGANNTLSESEEDTRPRQCPGYHYPSEVSDSEGEEIDWTVGGKYNHEQIIRMLPRDDAKFASVPSESDTTTFSRTEISHMIGGGTVCAWGNPSKERLAKGDFVYDGGRYCCLRQNANPGLPQYPGDSGILFVARRNRAQVGKKYQLFIRGEMDAEWGYYGLYRIAGMYQFSLEFWRSQTKELQNFWAEHVKAKKWGRKIMLKKGIISREQYDNYNSLELQMKKKLIKIQEFKSRQHDTISTQAVLDAFDREEKPYIRLNGRFMQPVEYDREFYGSLAAGKMEIRRKAKVKDDGVGCDGCAVDGDDVDDEEEGGEGGVVKQEVLKSEVDY